MLIRYVPAHASAAGRPNLKSKKVALAAGAVALMALTGGGVAYATASSSTATCTANPTITAGATDQSFDVHCSVPNISVTSTVTSTVTAPPQTVTVTGSPGTTTATPPPTSSTTATPPPTTTTTAPPGAFPNAASTGVPTGTTLTAYGSGGACNITTAGTVLDAKTINCDVVIRAAGVKITRSQVNGRIISNSDNYPGASVAITDSTINGGQQETFPSVSYTDITLTRVEVVGGQHSVQCSKNCTVTDSWLHNQYLPRTSAGHVNAFISNGGSGFVLRHNTLDCTVDPTSGGGCTADLSLFGDFSPISNATIDQNLFVANHAGYCLQAGYNPGKKYPNATGVKITGNVFQRVGRDTTKCGLYGPVTAYQTGATGNQWSGNTWDDGSTLMP